MTRQVAIAGHVVTLPLFAPTIFANSRTWFWKNGFDQEALLVSYDVLAQRPEWLASPLSDSLGFGGLVILDSGGFGDSPLIDSLSLAQVHRATKPHVGVSLDEIASEDHSSRQQWRKVRSTVANSQALLGSPRVAELRLRV